MTLVSVITFILGFIFGIFFFARVSMRAILSEEDQGRIAAIPLKRENGEFIYYEVKRRKDK